MRMLMLMPSDRQEFILCPVIELQARFHGTLALK